MHDATEQGPTRQPLAADMAYRHYLEHAEHCPDCNAGPCDTGAILWRAYREARDARR
ncbi:hypothetical protein PV703_11235 [Streptomyces sp. ME01-24h]|nr:hypothetical protein [Streptomyces sp. ME01-24h]